MKKRTQQLQLRVTPAEKSRIRAESLKSGMDMSSWILSVVLPDATSEFAQLVGELAASDAPMEAAAVWAELIDFLQSIPPIAFEGALSTVQTTDLDDVTANYLAALVEMAASQKSVRTPPWTRRIPPLDRPYFGTKLRRLREYLLAHAPVPFRRRNIFVDSGVGCRV